MQRTIEVDEFEMRKAFFPDILKAGGLCPCIAIGIYDPQTKSGYMMHEPSFRYANLDTKIQEIRADYGDLSKLKVFAAGNSLSSEDDEQQREREKAERSFVEHVLKKYFTGEQIHIEWTADDMIAELILDTSEGKFYLEIMTFD